MKKFLKTKFVHFFTLSIRDQNISVPFRDVTQICFKADDSKNTASSKWFNRLISPFLHTDTLVASDF